MEDNYIEKTVAGLLRFRDLYSEKIRTLDDTIAVIRALPSEESALSLVAELPAAADEIPEMAADGPPAVRPRPPHRRKNTVKPRKAGSQTKPPRAGHGTQKRVPSQYTGVTKKTGKRGVRFEALAWDCKKKRLVYVGRFDSEIEAAIAAAKARGDNDEVRRLSDLAEQIENNPDRPSRGSRRDDTPTAEPEIIYKCVHCRAEYQSRTGWCPRCGGEKFAAVKPEPQKNK